MHLFTYTKLHFLTGTLAHFEMRHNISWNGVSWYIRSSALNIILMKTDNCEHNSQYVSLCVRTFMIISKWTCIYFPRPSQMSKCGFMVQPDMKWQLQLCAYYIWNNFKHCIFLLQVRVKCIISVLKMAPVPWSATVASIAKQGLEVHHPLTGSVRHEQKMMEVKIVQKKYGFTKFLIEKCSVSITFFMYYSIIYRSNYIISSSFFFPMQTFTSRMAFSQSALFWPSFPICDFALISVFTQFHFLF